MGGKFSRPNALIGGFSWYNSNNEKRLETLEGRIEISKEKIRLPAAILWGQHDPILKSEWGPLLLPILKMSRWIMPRNQAILFMWNSPRWPQNLLKHTSKNGGRNTGFLPDIDAGLQGALHIHNIQPSLKLVADLPCDANFAKTQRFMQLDRAGISRIANDRHHLFKALFPASGDKGR